MLEQKTIEDVMEDVYETLGDPARLRYSEKFVRDSINIGQWEHARRSNSPKGRASITTEENSKVFNFPSDMIKPIRLETNEGKEIVATTSEQLEASHGYGFRTATTPGSPESYYSDLVGKGKFELYPLPTSSFSKDLFEFVEGIITTIESLKEAVLSYDIEGNRLYILTANFLFVYFINGEEITLEREVNHALALSYVSNVTQPMRVIKYKHDSGLASLTDSVGNTFFADGAVLRKIDINGTLSIVGTASDNIIHILEFEFYDVSWVYVQIDTSFDIERFTTGGTGPFTVSNIELNRITQSTGSFASRDIYFNILAEGVKRLDTVAHTVGAFLTTARIGGLAAVQDDDKSIYFNDYDANLISRIIPATDTLEATELTVSGSLASASRQMFSNLYDRFWYVDEELDTFGETVLFMQEVVAGVKTRKATPNFSRDSAFLDIVGIARNDFLFFRTADSSIAISAFERGVVTYIDGADFDQEEGVVTDIEDSEDPISFSQEEGAISGFTNNVDIATLSYVRSPDTDVVQVEPYTLLVDFVVFLAKKRNQGDVNRLDSALAFSEFMQLVDKSSSEHAAGHANKPTGTKSIWW